MATNTQVTLSDPRIQEVETGFRLQETEDYVVEVWPMLFNWRLVVMLPNQNVTIEHGYCYFGRGLDALAKATAAGLIWSDPLNSPPEGFDKQAF